MRLYNLKILFKVSLYLERSQLKQIITMHHWQEICGPSAVGKSTFLKFLQLNSEHRTAHIVSEVDFRSLFNVGNRTDFTFIDRQIAFASAAMSSLNDAIEQSPRVIADAGIVTILVFTFARLLDESNGKSDAATFAQRMKMNLKSLPGLSGIVVLNTSTFQLRLRKNADPLRTRTAHEENLKTWKLMLPFFEKLRTKCPGHVRILRASDAPPTLFPRIQNALKELEISAEAQGQLLFCDIIDFLHEEFLIRFTAQKDFSKTHLGSN